MKAFLTLIKFDFFSLSLLLCIALFLLPLSLFGQTAKADTGIIYGSTGAIDGGRLLGIDKSNGLASVIDSSTGQISIPAIAINSAGNIYASAGWYSGPELYRLSADTADPVIVNSINVTSLPAIAFNYKDDLFGLAMGVADDEPDNDYWYLIKIDTSTAEYNVLHRVNFEITHRDDGNWTGMSFNPHDGNLYACTTFGDIFVINPLTGERYWLAEAQVGNLNDLAFDNDANLYLALASGELASFSAMDTAAVIIGQTGNNDIQGLAARTLRRSSAQLGAFPLSIHFDLSGSGGRYSSPLSLTNTGTENLEISSLGVNAPFSIEGVSLPLVILPDSSVILSVEFEPMENSVFADNIAINSNDANNPQWTIPVYGESAAAPVGVLFGMEADEGLLLTIDPQTGHSDTLFGLTVDDDQIDYVTEIEFRQDGTLFIARGDGYEELFSANILSQQTQFVGDHDEDGLPGMDFGADGRLYAILHDRSSDSSRLVIVNQDNADIEVIGKTGYDRIRGITFSPDGLLYGAGPDTVGGEATDILLTIDPQTGIATKIGPIGFRKVTALEFGPDSILFGGLGDRLADSLDGGLIRVDPATGTGTFIGLTGAEVLSGLSFFPDLTPITISGLSDEISSIPSGLYLAQNYPNPFNPNTTIKFSLDRPEKVSLKIYNIAGQLVKTLFSEQLDRGSHLYKWNAHDFASGLYFYQLQAGSHSFTKKAILIK